MSVLTAVDEADALEQLHRLGCTDGLPVVIPTPDRVERFVLAAVADPTTSLGVMGPLGSLTTIEKVATNAVMAGCVPDHMPILVATLQALLRPDYDLSEAQSTTHSTDAARRRQRATRPGVRASPAGSARSGPATEPTRPSGEPSGCA